MKWGLISRYIFAGIKILTCKSCKIYINQVNLQVTAATTPYSTFAKEQERVDCLFVFHEKREIPNRHPWSRTTSLICIKMPRYVQSFFFGREGFV